MASGLEPDAHPYALALIVPVAVVGVAPAAWYCCMNCEINELPPW